VAERVDVERDDSRMFDLSSADLIQASAENFVAIYGREPAVAFAKVLIGLANPPPAKELSTKKSATAMRRERARDKGCDVKGAAHMAGE
jgi:hypothetical protein